MSDQREFTKGKFTLGNQLHSVKMSIPPPPLPPTFPPSIPPPPPIPPILFPPLFPTQTFQGHSMHPEPLWSRQPTNNQEFTQQFSQINPSPEQFMDLPHSHTFVDNWLKNKGLSKEIAKERATKRELQIHVVKEKYNTAYTLIKELENGVRTLSVMMKSVTPTEWEQKCSEIEEKKKELMHVMNTLKLSEKDIEAIKDKCLRRSKKRSRLRRQAERWKKQKEEEKVKTQNLHFQIDNWQKEMQEGVERIQREEELQREADAVLWGVTQKKSEARKQVALLSSLLELRQVRVQRLTAAGNPVSQSQVQTFNTVIEKLKKMWTKHLDGCLLEEQALRGMLSEADIKDDPVKTYKKLVLQEWETALFGSLGSLDSEIKRDSLVNIRRNWDQFIVEERTLMATTIPPGWVLPVPPSSDLWSTLLKY